MTPATISFCAVDEIEARVERREWAFARDHAGAIAAHWRGLVAEKPASFDGRVLMLSHSEKHAVGGRRVLRSAHFETSFSAFIAWRDFGFPDPSVKNCFAMAALCGDDGAFVLAEMGAHTANAGKIYFPAGTPDPEDVVGDRLDLGGSVLRELEEETGLTPAEVSLAGDWLLVEAGPRLACMRLARVSAPAAELARDLNARIALQTHRELAGVLVARDAGDLDPTRMPDFIVAYLRRMFAAQAG